MTPAQLTGVLAQHSEQIDQIAAAIEAQAAAHRALQDSIGALIGDIDMAKKLGASTGDLAEAVSSALTVLATQNTAQVTLLVTLAGKFEGLKEQISSQEQTITDLRDRLRMLEERALRSVNIFPRN